MQSRLLILRLDLDSHHVGCRGIAEQPAVGDLLLIKCFKVLSGRVTDRVVVRLIGLDHNISGLSPPPRSSGRRGQKLESAFRSPVIIPVEGQVRHKDSYQSHSGKIMSLDDHLGPQQDIRLLGGKGRQNSLITAFFSRCIRVHAENSGLGESLPEIAFDLFRSRPHGRDIPGAAFRTGTEGCPLISAVMTDKPSVSVKGQRDIAVRAFCHKTAASARDKTREPAPVDEEHALLALSQPVLYLAVQTPGKDRTVALPQLLPHIYRLDHGQGAAREPLVQSEEPDISILCAVIRLH